MSVLSLFELPNIEKPLYYTIEDFSTQEEFNNYIIEEIKQRAFIPLSNEEKEDRQKKRWRYYRPYLDWEVKFYANDSIVLRFNISQDEYSINFEENNVIRMNKKKQLEYQQKEKITAMGKIPTDILLSVNGFQKVLVTHEGYARSQKSFYACKDNKVVIAYLVGLDTFREFDSKLYILDSFEETYVKINREFHPEYINKYKAKKLMEKYQEIYGVDKEWRT